MGTGRGGCRAAPALLWGSFVGEFRRASRASSHLNAPQQASDALRMPLASPPGPVPLVEEPPRDLAQGVAGRIELTRPKHGGLLALIHDERSVPCLPAEGG